MKPIESWLQKLRERDTANHHEGKDGDMSARELKRQESKTTCGIEHHNDHDGNTHGCVAICRNQVHGNDKDNDDGHGVGESNLSSVFRRAKLLDPDRRHYGQFGDLNGAHREAAAAAASPAVPMITERHEWSANNTVNNRTVKPLSHRQEYCEIRQSNYQNDRNERQYRDHHQQWRQRQRRLQRQQPQQQRQVPPPPRPMIISPRLRNKHIPYSGPISEVPSLQEARHQFLALSCSNNVIQLGRSTTDEALSSIQNQKLGLGREGQQQTGKQTSVPQISQTLEGEKEPPHAQRRRCRQESVCKVQQVHGCNVQRGAELLTQPLPTSSRLANGSDNVLSSRIDLRGEGGVQSEDKDEGNQNGRSEDSVTGARTNRPSSCVLFLEEQE